MWTIGKLARHFGLSRSTLLYYDRIGLLSPSLRSGGNYRLYSPSDFKRMERIALLRDTGLSLDRIRELCEKPADFIEEALDQHLSQINREISERRIQQRIIAELLQQNSVIHKTRIMDKAQWVALLEGAGMDDEAKKVWHALFEKNAPEAHQDFLESLGIPTEEIDLIRSRSRMAIHTLLSSLPWPPTD
ncbi:MAG: MerR family transcriptional regulator [Magnetococcales bacterium]|nr:MerR family transcriptional regulator [Magnetococcales bacterium]